jgi:hypothetical protein
MRENLPLVPPLLFSGGKGKLNTLKASAKGASMTSSLPLLEVSGAKT